MKNTIPYAALGLICLVGMITFAIAGSKQLPPVSAKNAQELVSKKEAILVDVREPSEAAQGMAEPAVLMPLSEMENNSPEWRKFVAGLDKKRKVIVYCRSGRRSGIVGEKLAGMGFDVMNMGGFSSWEKAGLPVKKYELPKE